MIRIGVIGYGYWGPNLVRNFAEVPDAQVVAVSDLSPKRLSQVSARYPSVKTTTDCRDLFDDPTIDAVVVATPVSTHYDLALTALRADKHVLVEKPIAPTAEQASRLIETAAERDRILMVDHTFVYSGAVQRIKALVEEDRLGQLYYYDSVRVNLGLFQHDVNVLWDLAVHDLSIMDYVLGEEPCAVAASGMAHIPGQPVNIAYLTCFFEGNLLAHLHVNWLAPVKVRRTLIGGERQMIVYDDLEPSEKIKVYDKGITLSDGRSKDNGPEKADCRNGANGAYQMLIGYRAGDMWAPQLSLTEALRVEAEQFVECIEQARSPITDGQAGLRVIRILEAAERSLSQGGQPVELQPAAVCI
jgi:predicted dehydrogenase